MAEESVNGSWTARHIYTPLASRHIRLLKYTAVTHDNALALSLGIVSCSLDDDCPPFLALSYTWDEAIAVHDEPAHRARTYAVTVESANEAPVTISIRQNLYDALKTLAPAMLEKSRDHGMRHVWIDAVCINQDDLEERAQQVALMGEIFSSAASVWAWLGAADSTTATVIWLHTEVWAAIEDYSTNHGPYDIDSIISSPEGVHLPELDIFISDDQIKTLFRFYARRRFLNRLWIIQELVLGHDVVLWVDTHPLSMEAVRWWMSSVTDSEPYTFHRRAMANELLDAMQNIRALFTSIELRAQHRSGGPSDPAFRPFLNQAHEASQSDVKSCAAYLQYLLLLTGNHVATDPRDKLYGILGLVQPFWPSSEVLLLQPDYAADAEQMYYRMAVWCMHNQSSLAILSVAVRHPSCKQSSLPSWVPMLTARAQGAPTSLQVFLFGKMADMSYKAFCSNGLRKTADPQFRVEDKVLHARGHMLGQVASVSVGLPRLGQPGVDASSALLPELQLLEYMLACCISKPTYMNGQQMISAVEGCVRLGVTCDADAERADLLAHIAVFVGWSYKDAQPKEHAHTIRQRCVAMVERGPHLFGTEISHQIRHMNAGNIQEINYKDLGMRAIAFANMLDNNLLYRRMFRTDSGLIGLAHDAALTDDHVWILSDAKVPFILRPLSDDPLQYTLVGEAYVHGAMFGELVDHDNAEMWQDIEIV